MGRLGRWEAGRCRRRLDWLRSGLDEVHSAVDRPAASESGFSQSSFATPGNCIVELIDDRPRIRGKGRSFMNNPQTISAAAAGTFTIGGDLTVNRLGYGAMRVTGRGVWGPPADKTAALETLRHAIDLGVNLIDTADSYGPGTSEELIAEALFPYPAGLVIATKGGWERPGPGQWTHNASPKHLVEALEGSLKRLRVDRIDVYQLHVPDPAVSFEASIGTLARLREQGKIRHVALSNVTLEHVERARKIVPIVSVQNRYSFADREWDFLLNHCEKNGIAFIPWAPLGQNREANAVLEEAAAKLGATALQVAL